MISDTIYNELKEADDYEFQFIDNVVLRGKKAEIGLWGVRIK